MTQLAAIPCAAARTPPRALYPLAVGAAVRLAVRFTLREFIDPVKDHGNQHIDRALIKRTDSIPATPCAHDFVRHRLEQLFA